LGKSTTLINRWSSQHTWSPRVAAYDAALERAARADREALWAQRRRDLAEADWAQGAELRQWVGDALREAPKFLRRTETETTASGERIRVITLAMAAGPYDLSRSLKLASELQRLATGEPTDITRVVEAELEAALDRLKASFDEATYARIVAVIAGGA
jgi:hypothetical protein